MGFTRANVLSLLLVLGLSVSLVGGAPPDAKEPAARQASREAIARLIEQLGAADTAACDQAARQLSQIGEPARPQLTAALEDAAGSIRRRIDIILRGWDARAEQAKRDRLEARYRAFIAAEGDARLPGWTEFHQLFVGEDKVPEPLLRRVFVAMHRAEPELLQAYQDDHRKAARLLEVHLYDYLGLERLAAAVRRYHGAGLRTPVELRLEIAQQKPASVLAFFFAAGNREIEISPELDTRLYASKRELEQALRAVLSAIGKELENVKPGDLFPRGHEILQNTRWLNPKLLLGYLKRPLQGDIDVNSDRVQERIKIAVDSKMVEDVPFLLSLLNNEACNWETRTRLFRAIAIMGDRSHIAAVEPLLGNAEERVVGRNVDATKVHETIRLMQQASDERDRKKIEELQKLAKRLMDQAPEIKVQIRDMALGVVIELSGQNIMDYPFTKSQAAKYRAKYMDNRPRRNSRDGVTLPGAQIFFETPQDREEAIAKWHAWAEENLDPERHAPAN